MVSGVDGLKVGLIFRYIKLLMFQLQFEREDSEMLTECPESPVLMLVDSKGKPSSQETPGVGAQNGATASRKIFDSPSGTTILKDIGNHA